MGLKAFITKHFGGSKKCVNPKSPNSFPVAHEYRKVAPGSQPLPTRSFEAPISSYRYYERDTRRNYPQTVTFTASELKELPLPASEEARQALVAQKPVILDFKYKYREGAGALDPTGSAENPDFSIRCVQ
ncbi:hypothetical protein HDU91_005384 [Kappamyces sp. JEL0680]|nr:hypothetical protein HDU91_005384 [Kappamyces sp. JEL0680]